MRGNILLSCYDKITIKSISKQTSIHNLFAENASKV